MIKFYEFPDQVLYIPLLLNRMVFQNDFCAKNNMYVSKELLTNLIKKIKENDNKEFVIIDFSHMILADTKSLKDFCENLKTCSKSIVYCNVNEQILGIIKSVFDGKTLFSEGKYVISDNKGLNYYTNNLEPFNKKRDVFISDIIKKFIKKESLEKETFLSSSNLYANKYINIKNLFSNQDIYYLMINQLYNLISKYDENSYDDLLCVSLNGAVLATLLGQMIKKKVIYLMNLGPSLNIRDKESLRKIKTNNRYFFVADMLCTGTELKVVETLVNYRNAEIVGGIVVAQYLKPISEIQISKVFEINDDDDFGYKVYVKKV